MKRCTYLIIYLVAFIGTQAVNAQVPGYAGKRFSVNGEINTTPALYKINYNTDEYVDLLDYPNFGINLTVGLGIEYVLSRQTVAGINHKFNSLNTPLQHIYSDPTYVDDHKLYGVYLGDSKIINNYWGFYFKYYAYAKRGTIAPIGRFHQFELITGKGRMKTGDNVITDYSVYLDNLKNFPNIYEYGDIIYLANYVEGLGMETEVKQMYLKYAFGQETVWFDKLMVNMSVQVSVALSSYFNAYYEGDQNGGIGYAGYAEAIRDRSYGGVGFTLNLGLGYFVF